MPISREEITRTIEWCCGRHRSTFGAADWLMFDLMRDGFTVRRVGPLRFVIKLCALTLQTKRPYARYRAIMNRSIAVTVANVCELRGPSVPLMPQWKVEARLGDMAFDEVTKMLEDAA